ncbi:hypothetical protein Q669_10875 [Labrenzia sp. C1B10]|uniref:hypothetical protein n=1 Tax=unclassified Labrenzia TaxID=2648686 RepID=UPI0003B8F3C2|nr:MULTISPECIES: hypothetical protein [unclassified Labrenzia]ERP87260.1 hypothetical protein Q669_10875 [Labrenzia sp. C1B10]ERS07564.1 hypothetical protein Q675_19510 [Labrenzia sp. C1B70]
MSNINQKIRRKAEVKAKAQEPSSIFGLCRVIGCGKPTRAATSDGLDKKFCRSHAEHYQRHGSPYKRSYTANEVNPYRQAALLWIEDHEEDWWVQAALANVRGLYRDAGPHIEAFRLRGLTPRERANAAWARLSKGKVDPKLVVAAGISVEMIIQDDPQPDLSREFRLVQSAKLVHRLASGSHKKWTREVPDPAWGGARTKTVTEEMHVYPRPRGRVLRVMGDDIEEAIALLVQHHLAAAQAFKAERDKSGSHSDRPTPKKRGARDNNG